MVVVATASQLSPGSRGDAGDDSLPAGLDLGDDDDDDDGADTADVVARSIADAGSSMS